MKVCLEGIELFIRPMTSKCFAAHICHRLDCKLFKRTNQEESSCLSKAHALGLARYYWDPDIRIEHEESGTIFYLDPKLVEQSAWASTLRTFYFEPKSGSLKITDDAIHLLAGIPHDGKDGAWTFGDAKLIDLSLIHLRLKPEFQASNADLYPEP